MGDSTGDVLNADDEVDRLVIGQGGGHVPGGYPDGLPSGPAFKLGTDPDHMLALSVRRPTLHSQLREGRLSPAVSHGPT